MPLDILGTFAASGSSGASARNTARVSDPPVSTAPSTDAAALPRPQDTRNEEVQVSSPSANVAVFVSPFIRFDITSRLAIVEIRNSETGEVQQQYPSPRAVREYQQNLPEDSSLRPQPTTGTADLPQRIVGSAEERTPAASATDAPVPAPQPSTTTPAPAAAFSSLAGVPAGGKQVTIA